MVTFSNKIKNKKKKQNGSKLTTFSCVALVCLIGRDFYFYFITFFQFKWTRPFTTYYTGVFGYGFKKKNKQNERDHQHIALMNLKAQNCQSVLDLSFLLHSLKKCFCEVALQFSLITYIYHKKSFLGTIKDNS